MLTSGRVTVVVAVKDGAPFLADAVASVRAQHYPDTELVVVDDGSTDGTRQLAERLPIDQFVSLPAHQGVSTARNVAMAVASGEYVTFLDADDMYLPEKVGHQVAFLEAHPECGCVMTDHELVILPGVVPPSFLLNRLTPQGTAELMGLPICFMTRTRDIYASGGFDAQLETAEDMDILFRLQKFGSVLDRLHEDLVVKRIHGANATYRTEQMNRDLLRSMRKLMRVGQPSVSVVIPVHDGLRFLEAAVDSALDQTRPPDQIVIVDDGSTDGTVEAAHGLAARHPSIVVVRQPHLGAGVARNHGVLAARGSIIAFLDADDLWLPDKMERQLALLEGDPANAVAHGLVEEFLDPDLGPAAPAPRPPYPGPVPSDLVLRRTAFAAVGPFETRPGQPEWVQWWGRALETQVRVASVDRITSQRRRHAANITRSVDARAYLDVVREALNRRGS
jgi:glycosyltransferase involved in cell wall biosynthesis